MTENEKELFASSTKAESALDVVSLISSAVPWIGGPISNVLGGMSLGRKLGRVSEVLESIANDVQDIESDVSKNYVKTEEFEDMLEQALKRVGEERNKEKRHLYKAFLTDAIKSPGEVYDDQLRLLRTFEELMPDHLYLLKAMYQEPDSDPGMMGSPEQTLKKRLPQFSEQEIEEMVNQLNDMRVTNLINFKMMMTASGASDLRHVVTEYGKRIIAYINKA